MSKKYNIQVRRYHAGQTSHGSESIGSITGDFGKFDVVETVKRSLHAEQIGNFNPIFCNYNAKQHLVKSDEGDTSDPFRREESYAKSFFISI